MMFDGMGPMSFATVNKYWICKVALLPHFSCYWVIGWGLSGYKVYRIEDIWEIAKKKKNQKNLHKML